MDNKWWKFHWRGPAFTSSKSCAKNCGYFIPAEDTHMHPWTFSKGRSLSLVDLKDAWHWNCPSAGFNDIASLKFSHVRILPWLWETPRVWNHSLLTAFLVHHFVCLNSEWHCCFIQNPTRDCTFLLNVRKMTAVHVVNDGFISVRNMSLQ